MRMGESHSRISTLMLRGAAGCDDFDTKPVEIDRLIEKIQALVGKGRVS
jgi:hypothetical protein